MRRNPVNEKWQQTYFHNSALSYRFCYKTTRCSLKHGSQMLQIMAGNVTNAAFHKIFPWLSFF